MAGSRLASIALLLLAGFAPAWPAGPLGLDALVGWNGVLPEDRAAPLIVSVENDGGRLDCTVSVDIGEGGAAVAPRSSLVLSEPAVIPAHSVKRIPFVIPPLAPRRFLTLRVTAGGREAASTRVELPAPVRDRITVGVSSGMSLDFLGDLSEGVRVVYPHVENLPVGWAAYGGVERVVVHDLAFQDLGARQESALRGWIFSGGTLVVSGGPAALRLPGSSLDALLPVEVTGLTEARNLSGLAPLAGSSAAPRGPFAIARSHVRDGAIIADQGGVPLVAVRRIGRGAVYFLAFDCSLEALVRWPGNAALWRSLAGGPALTAARIEAREPIEDPWLKALSRQDGFSFPRPAVAAAFLAGLLAALVPVVNRWVGRRLRSRVRAAVLLATAALASVFAFFLFSRRLFPPEAVLLEASSARTVSGSGLAAATERVGVFATEARRVDLRVAGRDVLVQEGAATRDARGVRVLEVLSGEDTVLSRVNLPRFGSRLFQLEAIRELDVRVTMGGTAGSPKVSVENRSPSALKGCFLSFEGRLYPVPDVAPGAREERAATPAAGLGAVIPDPARQAFWEAAGAAGSGAVPVLFAWLDRPLLGVDPSRGTRALDSERLHLLAVEVP